ncbi:MAG: GWxTD domain-containing protein [Candidatus Aminicenantes bacterium]|nr:GWxTD domain-containing protein [Candidatus Aminicenantes bacterium]
MRQKKVVFIFLGTLLVFSVPMYSIAADKYEDWLKQEVDLIITDQEKKEFKKLKTDESKENYIKLFWAKRDPTPKTEKNEFKEEYYLRLEHVKDRFRYGYKTGLQTDQGKVYLLFGEPKVFNQGPQSGAQQDAEIWVYRTLPWMNYPKETFAFVFTPIDIGPIDKENPEFTAVDRVGYSLNRQLTDSRVMQAFYDLKNKIIFNPELTDVPAYPESVSFSPDTFEGDLILQVKSSGENIEKVPFEEKTLMLKSQDSKNSMTLFLKIGPNRSSDLKDGKVYLFGELESEELTEDFREEKKIIQEEDGSYLIYTSLPVMAGEYDLYLGFYTLDHSCFALKEKRITVPDYWGGDLAVSSLLASPQVEEINISQNKEELDAFHVGRYRLKPYFSQEYTKEQTLNVFYYIYNLSRDPEGNSSLTIGYALSVGGNKYNMQPQQRQQNLKEGDALVEGTRFPLSALPAAGEYELIVTVTDDLNGKSAEGRLKFTLIE